jgi:hypothetical protein
MTQLSGRVREGIILRYFKTITPDDSVTIYLSGSSIIPKELGAGYLKFVIALQPYQGRFVGSHDYII